MTTQLSKSTRRGIVSISVLMSLSVSSVLASVPQGYYDQVDTSTPQSLRNTLHEIIDDHVRFPYTSSSTDTWDILELADQDPNNPSNVIDVYKNASYAKVGGGNTNYNREHSWPKSYGFPSDGSTNYPYTDTHHLFIADSSYNSSRSNKPYADCDLTCIEKVTDINNNRGGTPSESNWTAGSGNTGTWQTWSGRKGDVARALMYMAVRYEGGTHGVTGVSEPDLILTDDRDLIGSSNQGTNLTVAYMGLKSVLLQWHKEDPVDDIERRHNDMVYSYQGNRNPFIDHPEYVDCVFEDICSGGTGDTTAPATPTGFSANGGDGLVSLAWNYNTESDLAGYHVYRSASLDGTYTRINTTVIDTSAYTDSNVDADTTYFYKVSAVDTSNNESVLSETVNATTNATPPVVTEPGTAWINEFHYDNDGGDVDEFVEIAGTTNTDLTGWQLVAYNGNGGTSYMTVNLSGLIAEQTNSFGVKTFSMTGLQNGSPDGIALVDNLGNVVQFISYEGSMTAVDGPAAGMNSADVGVSETSTTPVGHSLQLAGSGSDYQAFTWQSAQLNTSGSVNIGQQFEGGSAPVNQDPVAEFLVICNGAACTLNASNSADNDGSILNYEWILSDGSSYSGISVDHLFASEGDYSVTLTVTDNEGGTNSVSQNITISLPPEQVLGVTANVDATQVHLNWQANSESDLAGYHVYRSNSSAGQYSQLNSELVQDTFFIDTTVEAGTTYYYKVSALDLDANESTLSSTLSVTTDSVAQPLAWINEIHYDNKGTDRNEFIEIAGTAGTDISGWQLIAYNGGDGRVYDAIQLSGVISNQQNGFGTLAYDFSGLQNGSNDGIALVNANGDVVQFISYEGVLVATDGPAIGLSSEDIGVSETSSTRRGQSLQLVGYGSQYSDFIWQAPTTDSPGWVNSGQSF
jgi:endonuclease I/fibronectin type 3 domain-containing protein